MIPGGIYEASDRGRDEFSHPSPLLPFIMKSAFIIRPLPLMVSVSIQQETLEEKEVLAGFADKSSVVIRHFN